MRSSTIDARWLEKFISVYLLYLITLFIPGHLCTINQQLGKVVNLYVHGIYSLKGISNSPLKMVSINDVSR